MLAGLKNHPAVWEMRRLPLWQNLRYDEAARHSMKRETDFYRQLLEGLPRGAVLDVGANSGSKTEIFRSMSDFVVAIEPTPRLVHALKNRFQYCRNIKILDCAVSSTNGTSLLHVFEGDDSYNTLAPEWASALRVPHTNRFGLALTSPEKIRVQTCTLAELVQEYGPIKYVKIDAEGYEYEIVSSLETPVPLISLEFNLPEFAGALNRSIEKLHSLSGLYRFNAAVTEPPMKLELSNWVPAEEMREHVNQSGWHYAELFARLAPA